ncbi:MAG: two-component regulator propeller domain-containing protein [Halioglobus sp.]
MPYLARADLTDAVDIDFQLAPFSKTLTQQTVSQTFQDSRGILWFVTQEGLNRYNGYELENYRYSLSDPLSLSTDRVTGIAEDSNGDLWVSTLGGGLNKFDPIRNGFTVTPHDPKDRNSPLSNSIYSVFGDRDGVIWLGYKNGISSYDTNRNLFQHYESGDQGIPDLGIINHFTQTSDGIIWAATTENGFIEIDISNGEVSLHQHSPTDQNSIPSNSIYRIVADARDRIWLASQDAGVSLYDTKTGTTKHFRHDPSDLNSLASNRAYYIFEDQKNRIWIGTHEGLNLYDEGEDRFYRFTRQSADLPSDRIYSIFQSREGKFWVGTFFGLVSGSDVLFRKINSETGQLSSESVNAFSKTSDGSLWVGTDDGLNRLRPGKNTFEWINESTSPGISSPTVMSLLAEGESLWVGTYNGGLNKIDLKTDRTTTYRHKKFDQGSIGASGITSILRTSAGQLIVGTFGGGISLYHEDSDSFTSLKHDIENPSSISSNNVIALFQDSLDMIWVGTENGLNRYHPSSQEFERFYANTEKESGLSSDMVWAFYEDDKNSLWLGTRGGGLNRWSDDDRKLSRAEFQQYSNEIDLPSSNIYGIQSGKDGNLWLSHNRGVTKFNPSTLKSHQYGIRDGLQDTEFNMGASYKGTSGVIYFGGNRGYNVISSTSQRETSAPPQVSISEIRIMNERVELEKPYYNLDQLELEYEDKMFSIQFFAADYSNPDLIKYAYKLEGINPDWVISNETRTASFTTLPSGKYQLRLAAASPDGVWNWDGVSLPIVVHPPIWLSPAAYFIYALSIITLFIMFVFRQKRQAELVLQRQRELEKMVDERTADLEESRHLAELANNAKSDFLATMSHEIRTPMHGMIGMTELLLHTDLTEQQKRFANAAHNSGEALLGLINDILDFSKIEASKVELEAVEFNLFDLIDEICYLQGEPAQRKKLSLNSIYDQNIPDMVVADPTRIRQVVMNLVSNSIKFTHVGEVNIRVSSMPSMQNRNQTTLCISVEDSGIGMDGDTQKKVFEAFTQADTSTTREYGGTGLGLAISRQYIELMGGEIDVKSQPNLGTNISFRIPVQIPFRRGEGPNLEFSSYRARILCGEKSTVEMLTSHLLRLGIESSSTEDTSQFAINDDKHVIYFADYESRIEQNLTPEELGIFEDRRGVLLTYLTHSSPPDIFQEWTHLSKPTTSSSLRDAILEVIGYNVISEADSEPKEIHHSRAHAKNILVAEDVETNQKIAREMIQLLGCKVDIANNGKEAIEMYLRNSYDLIFMDCQMPILDGYEATLKIRKLEEDNQVSATPIIALTAGITKEDELRCREIGMDQYLTKPYSMSQLTNILQTFTGYTAGKTEPHFYAEVNVGTTEDQTESDHSSLEIINMSSLNNIREVEKQTGNKILPSIYDGFVTQMVEKLKELSSNYQSHDSDALYKTAHAIKSMSANIGADRVKFISAKIESLARNGDLENAQTHFSALDEVYHEFLSTFRLDVLDVD